METKWHYCAALGGSALLAWWLWKKRRDPYGFDTVVDRRGFNTVKYDLSPVLFGEEARDCLQHWVADMDFPCCEKIQKALAKRMSHPTYGYTILPHEVWRIVGQWLVENQNWPSPPSPECFVFSGTVLSSVGSILRTFTSPGDKVRNSICDSTKGCSNSIFYFNKPSLACVCRSLQKTGLHVLVD